MADIDYRLPIDADPDSATGGPSWSTQVARSVTGNEQRIEDWDDAIAEWDLGYSIRSLVATGGDVVGKIQEIQNLFNMARGMSRTFRVRDWADYEATGQALGTGDGTTKNWQLTVTYDLTGDNGNEYVKNIYCPDEATIVVYKQGIVLSEANWEHTGDGIIQVPSSVVGEVYTVDFDFDKEARFDTDRLRLSIKLAAIGIIPPIPIVEVLRSA